MQLCLQSAGRMALEFELAKLPARRNRGKASSSSSDFHSHYQRQHLTLEYLNDSLEALTPFLQHNTTDYIWLRDCTAQTASNLSKNLLWESVGAILTAAMLTLHQRGSDFVRL